MGSGLLTSSSIVFKDVDRPSDLTTSSAQPLIRSVVELRRPDLFIAAVKAYSRGLAEEAYEFLAKEAKLYRSLGVHSLELAAMVDMLVVGRKAKDRELREVEARVAELRALMGRSPKVPQPKVS